HDFKYWHDMRIDEYNTAKNLVQAKQRAEMEAKFALVAKKYLPLEYHNRGSYVICIAKSRTELEHEGEVLDHCVGRMNYDQKILREETLIFFIRSKTNPNTPYVTLEYSLSNKKILQCYGNKNTIPEQSVLDYVNKIWLPYANKQIKKIAA
ncbi:hypothetical protein EOM82_09120, partial [bacterium]|nr:hypothetical protein [bacterium]